MDDLLRQFRGAIKYLCCAAILKDFLAFSVHSNRFKIDPDPFASHDDPTALRHP